MDKNRRMTRTRKTYIKPYFRIINGKRRRIRGYFRKKIETLNDDGGEK